MPDYRKKPKQGGKTNHSHPAIQVSLHLALTLENGSGPPSLKFYRRLCVYMYVHVTCVHFSGERAHSWHPILREVHDLKIPRGCILRAFSDARVKIDQILTLSKLVTLSLRLSFLLSKMR